MTPFRLLATGPGQALVWAAAPATPPTAAGPAEGPVPCGAWRERALAAAPRRVPEGALSAVTWLDAACVAPDGWPQVLQGLRALPGAPLVRIELEPEAAGTVLSALSTERVAQWAGEPEPVWVQLPLHRRKGLPPAALDAAEELVAAGLPVAAELRLVRGETDDPAVLRALCLGLLARRVRPQALILAEWLPEEWRVSEAAGLELVRGLRGWISGVAAPQLVREGRDGFRSVCVPEYVTSLAGGDVRVRNYRGDPYRYRDPPASPLAVPPQEPRQEPPEERR